MYQDHDEDPRSQRQKLVAELERQAREADKEDLELRDAMEALIRRPEWAVYTSRVLGPRIQSFADALLAPAGSVDGAVALEHLKGSMSGLILARDLPQVIIAATKEIRPAANDEEV